MTARTHKPNGILRETIAEVLTEWDSGQRKALVSAVSASAESTLTLLNSHTVELKAMNARFDHLEADWRHYVGKVETVVEAVSGPNPMTPGVAGRLLKLEDRVKLLESHDKTWGNKAWEIGKMLLMLLLGVLGYFLGTWATKIDQLPKG